MDAAMMAQIETTPPLDILAVAIARRAAAADRHDLDAAQSDLDRVYALIEELSAVIEKEPVVA